MEGLSFVIEKPKVKKSYGSMKEWMRREPA